MQIYVLFVAPFLDQNLYIWQLLSNVVKSSYFEISCQTFDFINLTKKLLV